MKGKIKRVWKRVGYTSFVLFSLYQIYLSVRIYWFTFCVIPTYSMSPTLLGGDYILASLQIPGRRIIEEDESWDERKLVHRLEGIRQVRKNDVVVFNYPYSEDKEKMILSAKLFFVNVVWHYLVIRISGLPARVWKKCIFLKLEIYCQLIPVTTTTTDTV